MPRKYILLKSHRKNRGMVGNNRVLPLYKWKTGFLVIFYVSEGREKGNYIFFEFRKSNQLEGQARSIFKLK